MSDLALRFADEAEAQRVLSEFVRWEIVPSAPPADPFNAPEPERRGVWITSGHQHALDPIGPVEVQPAVRDENGAVISAGTFDTRYHVNLRLLDDEPRPDLEPYRVHPTNPKRVWG